MNSLCERFESISWKKVHLIVLGITFSILVTGICGYFIGTFRPDYIKKYNKVAQIWEERGSSEFSNNVFYLVDSVSQRILVETDCSSGVDYPVRDRCNLVRDPPGGCILTNATYYYGESYVQSNENWISIVSAQNTTIFNTAYQKNISYILDRDDLGCSHNPEMCDNYCNSKYGKWNYKEKLCRIVLFAHEMCIRLELKDNKWIVDRSMHQYPMNREFSLYDSDYHGCTYNNNWNSIVYGIGDHPMVYVTVRSSLDSYIAASGYTKGCSSSTKVDNNCFGDTHVEERFVWFMLFHVACGFLAFELLVFIFFASIKRFCNL